MAQCKTCGLKSIFLRVDAQGNCAKCAEMLQRKAKKRAAQEAAKQKAAQRASSEQLHLQQVTQYYEAIVAAHKQADIGLFCCTPTEVPAMMEAMGQFEALAADSQKFADAIRTMKQCDPRRVYQDFRTASYLFDDDTYVRSLHTRYEDKRRTLSKMLAETQAFQADLADIPLVDCDADLTAEIGTPVNMSDIPESKTSNIPARTPRAGISNYIVNDLETTGLSPARAEIIELCAMRFVNFQPVEAFRTYVKPRKGLQPEAAAINHITDEDVQDAPWIEQVLPAFDRFIGTDAPIVGHNVAFDYSFLARYNSSILADAQRGKRKFYDTCDLARRTFEQEKNTLEYLSRAIFGLIREDAHSALSDCLVCGKLFQYICAKRMGLED